VAHAVIQIVLYAALIVTPLLVATITSPLTGHGHFFHELGKSFALIGATILAFQALLASRIKWVERPFGFDILIRFHKNVAVFASLLLLAHPFLIGFSHGTLQRLLLSTQVSWPIWFGRIALLILLINVFLSGAQRRIGLKWNRWRILHDLFAPVILALVFFHAWTVGSDLLYDPVRVVWVLLFVMSAIVYSTILFIKPWILDRRRYRVSEVKRQGREVWTVKLTPPKGKPIFDYLPGQFQFVTFYRGRGLPVEEHHWTISSSPTERHFVSSTIKNLGDFTSTMGETRAGDTARVDAPYGRFSFLLHQEERSLVFIAGGIGITPVRSMLRYMRDKRMKLPVDLFYGNRTEEDILFREELIALENKGNPRLRVIHVLSKPSESWKGETGHIDKEKLTRYLGDDLEGKGFYLVGPKPLLDASIQALKELGVPDKRMHMEIFAFLD
jgi:predicted ferric reductase